MEEIVRSIKRLPIKGVTSLPIVGICRSPFASSRSLKRFYYQDEQASNSTWAVFRCFANFHHVSGDMLHECIFNESWIWQEPLCEVDYYMERFRLSILIVAVVMFLGFAILVPDFLRFHKCRNSLKNKKRDIRQFERFHHRVKHERTLGFQAFHDSELSLDPANSEDDYGTSVEAKTNLSRHDREIEDIFSSIAPKRSTEPSHREPGRKPGTILAIFSQAFKSNQQTT